MFETRVQCTDLFNLTTLISPPSELEDAGIACSLVLSLVAGKPTVKVFHSIEFKSQTLYGVFVCLDMVLNQKNLTLKTEADPS